MAEEDLKHFRATALWAIGRLGSLADKHIGDLYTEIVAALDNSDPQVRGTAAWCLGQVGRATALADRADLLSDEGPVAIYENGSLERTTVGVLAQRVLAAGPVGE